MTSLSENGFGNNGRRRQTSPQNPQSKPPRTEISDHKLDPVRFRRLSVQAHQRIHGGPAVARVALLSAMVVCKPAHLFLDELEIEYDEQDDYVVIKRRSPPRSCHDQFLKGFDMGTKMKGIYKGFKYTLSQMFVEKDREDEIEIGFPTDVKHVSHIGWDGSAGNNAPSWMNEFRTGPDFASASIGKSGSSLSPWSHQDQAGSDMLNDDLASPQVLGVKKKQKRRKPKTNSSPKSNSPNSTRSSRASKSKTKFVEGDKKPVDIEVA